MDSEQIKNEATKLHKSMSGKKYLSALNNEVYIVDDVSFGPNPDHDPKFAILVSFRKLNSDIVNRQLVEKIDVFNSHYSLIA